MSDSISSQPLPNPPHLPTLNPTPNKPSLFFEKNIPIIVKIELKSWFPLRFHAFFYSIPTPTTPTPTPTQPQPPPPPPPTRAHPHPGHLAPTPTHPRPPGPRRAPAQDCRGFRSAARRSAAMEKLRAKLEQAWHHQDPRSREAAKRTRKPPDPPSPPEKNEKQSARKRRGGKTEQPVEQSLERERRNGTRKRKKNEKQKGPPPPKQKEEGRNEIKNIALKQNVLRKREPIVARPFLAKPPKWCQRYSSLSVRTELW